MTKSAIIPIFLAFLLASSGGLAQQMGDENNGTQNDFHPKQLTDRVIQTRSMGGLTKLSLKKDYDRLLKMTRAYHEGLDDISLQQLQDRFDVMYHRLRKLLQNKDEEFLRFINDSKDIFWLMLSDEEQFANMMGIPVIGTQREYPPSDIDAASDLRTVIILAGYPCNSVVEYSQATDSAYHVSCGIDRLYRVAVSEEEDVIVNKRSAAAITDPLDEMSHDELMKRQLLSVVNLAGHDCAELANYERYESNNHLVTCENQTVYRIHVTPEGQVAVDRHPTGK